MPDGNTTDIGDNTTNIAGNATNIANNVTNITTNAAGIGANARAIGVNTGAIAENREGVAMGMAVAGTLNLPPGINFALTGNWGNFEGDNAIGFSGTARLSKNIFFNAGFGAGLRRGTTGGRAGFTALW